MAFGVLFDFTGNANASKVIPASEMVKQTWFIDAINTSEPVDLFLLIGHNIARPSTSGSTFQVVHNAIRAIHTTTPIQIFGGHSHQRDFAVVDEASTALESGRYCETVGWFSMSGFNDTNSGRTDAANPVGVANPTRKAIAATSNKTETSSPFVYSRRYLDWNRYTFQYHTVGAGNTALFETPEGLNTTNEITDIRTQQRLGEVYGCVPAFYCQTCVPFGDPTNIFTVMTAAASEIIVNPNRTDKARMIFANTGGIRFDMHKGPFTYDDNFIVSPFRNVFRYIPDVPFADASNLIHQLNSGGADKRSLASMDASSLFGRDACVDPEVGLARRDASTDSTPLGIGRRQVQETQGYTTTDDFGTDGDDTEHSAIPSFSIPLYYMATGGYPKCRNPDKVDVIFIDLCVLPPFYSLVLSSHPFSLSLSNKVASNLTCCRISARRTRPRTSRPTFLRILPRRTTFCPMSRRRGRPTSTTALCRGRSKWREKERGDKVSCKWSRDLPRHQNCSPRQG